MSAKPSKPLEKFEEAFERLDEIVTKLEGGEVALEESLELYAEGMTLVRFCNDKLAAAKERIEKLKAGSSEGRSGSSAPLGIDPAAAGDHE